MRRRHSLENYTLLIFNVFGRKIYIKFYEEVDLEEVKDAFNLIKKDEWHIFDFEKFKYKAFKLDRIGIILKFIKEGLVCIETHDKDIPKFIVELTTQSKKEISMLIQLNHALRKTQPKKSSIIRSSMLEKNYSSIICLAKDKYGCIYPQKFNYFEGDSDSYIANVDELALLDEWSGHYYFDHEAGEIKERFYNV